MNSVNLVGRMTKDVDLRYAGNGNAYGNFILAVQRTFKNKSGEYEADFITCKAFGKRTETLADNVRKGNQVAISGKIQTGSYEKDGMKIYTTDVIVDSFTFIGGKETSKEQGEEKNWDKPEKDPFEKAGKQIDIQDSDLPF